MIFQRGSLAHYEQWFRRSALLMAVFSAPVSVVINPRILSDPDLWFHLRMGEWILQHARLPLTDPFSAYGSGKTWIAYSWLFDVAVYGGYRTLNLLGIVALQLVLALAIGFALYRLISHLQPSFIKSVILTAVGLLAMLPLFSPRPWLFTILFFIIELDIVMAVRGSGESRRLLLLLPLFCLWANLHIQFLYGLFLLVLATAEAAAGRLLNGSGHSIAASRCPASHWAAITAGCVLATLVNPYHIRLYGVIYGYMKQAAIYRYVAEFQALSFRDYQAYLVLSIALAASFALGWSRRITLLPVALLVSGAFLSFRTQRDCWFVVVAGLAIVASLCGSISRRYNISKPQWIFVGLGATAILLGATGLRHVSNASMAAAIAQVYPADAARIIEQRAYPGPLFNYYDWGGYIMWRLHQLPVSIDGRTDLHGDLRIARSVATWNGAPDWASDQELMNARLVLGPRNLPLCSLLRHDPRFELVYDDAVASVFIAKRDVQVAKAHEFLKFLISGGSIFRSL